MAYKHGIYGSEVPTSLLPMTEVAAGLPVVFGTAPLHLATKSAGANTPKLCYSNKEAVQYFGYSKNWEDFTLCEFMNSQFALYGMAPAVFVNVLDPNKSAHVTNVNAQETTVTDSKITLKATEYVLLDTLKVAISEVAEPAKEGTDYTAAYNDDNELVITILTDGALNNVASLFLSYTKLNPAGVTASDIVGGIDPNGKLKGLELVSEVFQRFRLVPGTIIAPKFSGDSTVAAVMKAKETGINGCFEAISIADIPTDLSSADVYSKAPEWKEQHNFVDSRMIACWPKGALSGVQYHLSTQLTGLLCKTDSEHDDVPYWSPSNHSLQIDSTVLEDGSEVFLDTATADYLNGNGIVTSINFIGGWKAWGNRISAYPSNTDPKDAFIPIRRMFNWLNNTLITTFWSKIDNPTNKRLIRTVVDSANIWLNGLTAKQYILGGRVEFREDENTTTDLMDGKIYFHVYFTPPSPARDIEFVQEYDPDYVSTLFD